MLKLKSKVREDQITDELSNSFDYQFCGETTTSIKIPQLPNSGIGLIVGASGSGKTTILSHSGAISTCPEWEDGKAICSHFSGSEDAKEKLGAVGLNSIPCWMREYKDLSNGERFRADMARQIEENAAIDEFTSVVDRAVAKSCAWAMQRYIRNKNIARIIFASCHYDVIDWLMPDWVYDCGSEKLSRRGSERRPEIKLELLPCSPLAWALFSKHHYLSGNINKSSRCWIATWEGVAVGFASVIAFPNGNFKNAWREHRTVVLPDFQGLGIGVRISDCVGEIIKSLGGRYFSKTSNFRMGGYRENSDKWRATSKNKRDRKDYSTQRNTKEKNYKHKHMNRICFSHEYVGDYKNTTTATGD